MLSIFNTNPYKKTEIYSQYLHELSGVHFTSREIDVMSCVLHNRGEKKIAILLNISYRTVGTHIRNIMNKLGQSSSREYIIDSIEKSGKLQYMRQYYFHLVLEGLFIKFLKKIATTINHSGIIFSSDFNNLAKEENELLEQLIDFLKLANINLLKSKSQKPSHHLYVLNDSVSEKKDVVNNNENNIGLIFEQDIDLSIFTNIKYVDFRKDNNYYFAAFELIENILNNPNSKPIIQSFKDDCKALQDSWNGTDFKENQLSNKKLLSLYSTRNKILASVAIITIIIMSYNFFFLPKNEVDISTINKKFSEFIHLYSADNITIQNEVTKNYSLVREVEEIVSNFDSPGVQNYFKSKSLSQNELINCLYIMHALATNYTYNEHNGKKAHKVLKIAKDIAEHYAMNQSNVKINFDKLTPKEIYQELHITPDLAEIYTKILYLLGSSCIYQGKFDNSARFYQLSSFLGMKLKLFEGYLSYRGGLNVIRRSNVYKSIEGGNYDQAKKLLVESINSLEKLREDTQEYRINYRPGNIQPRIIVPANDDHNRVFVNEQIVKSYIKLIEITESSKQKLEYAKYITEYFIGSKSIPGMLVGLQKTVSKRSAGICNSLGMALLRFIDEGINFDDFKQEIIKELNLKNGDDLFIAQQIFDTSKEKSRNTDYTRADAHHGLMLVYEKRLQEENINKEQITSLKIKIKELKMERDDTNKRLNRNDWKLRIQDSMY